MFDFKKKILLGSGSPRRKTLLKELGIDFRILVSETDEIPLPHLLRGDIAKYLADEKADILKNKIHADEILITADTIVWLNSSMLGKPENEDEAFRILSKLNGCMHQVYTGICLMDVNTRKTFCVESNVLFRRLTETEIREYVHLYKPFDKAGAYGAQESLAEGVNPCSEKEIKFLKKYGIENLFERTLSTEKKKRIPIIDHIDGSYFNVMGLPVVELIEELKVFCR